MHILESKTNLLVSHGWKKLFCVWPISVWVGSWVTSMQLWQVFSTKCSNKTNSFQQLYSFYFGIKGKWCIGVCVSVKIRVTSRQLWCLFSTMHRSTMHTNSFEQQYSFYFGIKSKWCIGVSSMLFRGFLMGLDWHCDSSQQNFFLHAIAFIWTFTFC